ncbi:DUF1624 domain-containing protein [Flammeovirga agarivorans]|uniref:DUF1624 domain-containing protein n=1 Tax=Flammeovirga agarivorans TaxID=2726742 RepID=A0A7X8SQD8_9BACT|nr:heparan-alpha-glucosaminide N-acetyltransferase domain-containing protein [Flammeovirga agarivorans]NLR94484.1 DUF1624 domain-containing protein [Flammeovirga agarivorans]
MKENQDIPSKSSRIYSIDILRGLVMLFMLLDHVRERFFYHVPISDPIDIHAVSSELFFTRILAHLCAPVFVFLTGLSAWLYAHPKGKPERSASGFLFKRGLLIILVEVTLINFSWFGEYKILFLQVMWAIGVSMICLSVLSKLPHRWIGIVGFIIVFGHNTLTNFILSPDEWGFTLWTILYQRGYILSSDLLSIKASYPVLPWIGVILLGYFTGPLFGEKFTSERRIKALFQIGLGSLILLCFLRGWNIYGETLPWERQETFIQSVMSFLNFKKYPPSLDFLLLTIGIGMFLLLIFERFHNKFTSILKTFGSAPMFFYIMHLYVLLSLYKMCIYLFGTNQGNYFGLDSLWQIWLVTIVLSVFLYFPTRAFSNYKKKSHSRWIKYF